MKKLYLILIAIFCWQITVPAQDYNQPYRPQFHFSPERNWINDPCGMVFYKGKYHLMYQYNPLGSQWGNMSWGHAVSTDMVHWEHLPVAMLPDNLGQIFSGGAVVDWDNSAGFNTAENEGLIAIFTHAGSQQRQSIAYSTDEGQTWTKYSGNPVLPNPGIADFRDPQVFWHEPTAKWVMTLAAFDRIKFYSSPDLKSWTFESDFVGNIGANGGVWECPDLFPIQVEGTNEIKWVLMVSLNPGGPAGGSGTQYFVGDFDGTVFTLLPEYEAFLSQPPPIPQGDIFEDFEGGNYSGWFKIGTAFGNAPATGALPGQQVVSGYLGNGLVNSFLNGDTPTGALTSENFIIQKPFINFLIGGGNHPGLTEIRLQINGSNVRTATGKNSELLTWVSWDVSDLQGQEARLQIVDNHSGGWGHINIDHILFSDEAAENPLPIGFWADFGPDNYAGRSWENMPQDNYQRVWLGWMSNWAYAGSLPTSPWRGSMTIPRSIGLRQFPFGLRLVQRPIQELDSLREEHFQFVDKNLAQANQFISDNSLSGDTYELKMQLVPGSSSKAGIRLRMDDNHFTEIGYDALRNEVFLDRSNASASNFDGDFTTFFKAPFEAAQDTIRLHIYVDRSSVELFAGEGELVITARIFPAESALGLSFFQEGSSDATIAGFDFWTMKTVWDFPNMVEETSKNNHPEIYPNPVRSVVYFQESLVEKQAFSISDTTGAVVKSGVLMPGQSSIAVEELRAGIYFLRVNQGVVKFVKH